MNDLPVKVDLKAEIDKRDVSKLVDVAADTFSVATESLGLLGDAVRLARVELAARITLRAKEIADATGLKLTAPPLKFLVPFYEKASIEDENETQLTEMWANLLVSAGSRYSATQLRYSSILAELSGEQATILDAVVKNFGDDGSGVDVWELEWQLMESRFTTDVKEDFKEESTTEALLEKLLGKLCVPGVSVVTAACSGDTIDEYLDFGADGTYEDSKAVSFEILCSHGLLTFVTTPFFPVGKFELTATYYIVTKMGYDFWVACSGTSTTGKND